MEDKIVIRTDPIRISEALQSAKRSLSIRQQETATYLYISTGGAWLFICGSTQILRHRIGHLTEALESSEEKSYELPEATIRALASSKKITDLTITRSSNALKLDATASDASTFSGPIEEIKDGRLARYIGYLKTALTSEWRSVTLDTRLLKSMVNSVKSKAVTLYVGDTKFAPLVVRYWWGEGLLDRDTIGVTLAIDTKNIDLNLEGVVRNA